jgi:hypothetical protein
MLWIPPRKTLKALAKNKRRRWRRRVARLLLFVAIVFVITAASVAPAHDIHVDLQQTTVEYQFDFVDWISLAAADEIGRRLFPPEIPRGPEQQRAIVDDYLRLEEDIRRLEDRIDELYATGGQFGNEEQQLAAQKQQLSALVPQVETIISRQIEMVLRDEGFVMAGQVMPPVAFRLVDAPTALIVSPRDKIERKHFVGLLPGLESAYRNQIEDHLQQRGDVSAYVTDVGGLGSYPTMVVGHPWLPWLIDTTAHEWVHNYLYTFPTNMAWGYGNFPRLTTVNETTASLVGEEVSRKVIEWYYPDWIEHLPDLSANGQPETAEPSEFQMAMREIRQQVDLLLAEGKIDEAEIYMETKRQNLVNKGYNLRRLNQAYFAFHGSYALSPGSIDPTGPQIRQLRAHSPTLKTFLDNIGWLNSYADYEQLLRENNITPELTVTQK